MRRSMLLLACLMVALPALAQSGGTVTEINPQGTVALGPLNPVLCDGPVCNRINHWLFPTLFAVDPATGLLIPGGADNNGLALSPPPSPGTVETIDLRPDLTWSDGTPVTAYDVAYSYFAYHAWSHASVRPVVFVRVRDDHTLDLYMQPARATDNGAGTCEAYMDANFQVIPAHVYDPAFHEFIDSFAPDWDAELDDLLADWFTHYPTARFDDIRANPEVYQPTVTAGAFVLDRIVPGDGIYLQTPDGATGYVLRDPTAGLGVFDLLRQGQVDLVLNPGSARRPDVQHIPGADFVTYPSQVWDYISFNVADPFDPQPIFGADGIPIEQGHHPIFGDSRVRRAVQLALNVEELIEIGARGDARQMSAHTLPGSWAYDPTLAPVPHDLDAARQLLAEAGWYAAGDGARICDGCLYAQRGQSLSFDLLHTVGERQTIVAQLVARQLRAVGFNVNVHQGSFNEINGQRYDAYLGTWQLSYPGESDPTVLFASQADSLHSASMFGGGLLNAGSYANAEADALMQQIRALDGCDIEARRQLHAELGRVLQADPPYAWLYSVDETAIVRDNIAGFDPLPGFPLWNVTDWHITRQEVAR